MDAWKCSRCSSREDVPVLQYPCASSGTHWGLIMARMANMLTSSNPSDTCIREPTILRLPSEEQQCNISKSIGHVHACEKSRHFQVAQQESKHCRLILVVLPTFRLQGILQHLERSCKHRGSCTVGCYVDSQIICRRDRCKQRVSTMRTPNVHHH